MLEEKLALAWSLVHGFAMLMLDNPSFAGHVRASEHGVRDFVVRVLRLAQPGFEAHAIITRSDQLTRSVTHTSRAKARSRLGTAMEPAPQGARKRRRIDT